MNFNTFRFMQPPPQPAYRTSLQLLRLFSPKLFIFGLQNTFKIRKGDIDKREEDAN